MYLRKLIKYEESIGVDVHQKDYFDNLYRKTTVSYRAKLDADASGQLRQGVVSVTKTDKIDRENLENGLRRKGKLEKKARDDEGSGCVRRRMDVGVLKENAKQKEQSTREANTVRCSRASVTKRRDEGTAVQTAARTCTVRSSRTTEKTTGVMWIRPRSKTPHSSGSNCRHRNKDPVQLYQYYQHEWEKFKNNLPGENSRTELRWQIRQKLLGE